MAVTVFSKKPCTQCDATYRKLDKVGVEYTVVDAEHDPTAREFVTKQLGFLQMPVVLVHDGDWIDFVPTDENRGVDFWSGYRPDQLEMLAKRVAATDAPAEPLFVNA